MTDFTYPSFLENRDTMLRTIAYGFSRRGIVAEIKPGSDQFNRAEAYARRITIAIANGQLSNTARNPLTALGDDMLSLASVFGIFPRPASKAVGYTTITGASTTWSVPAGYRATGPNGLKYETTIVNNGVTHGSKIEIRAMNTGEGANLVAGTVLVWEQSSVGFMLPKSTVSTGGIDGGTDEDTVEVVRQRLIDRLSFPQGGGNWPQVREWAINASSAVSNAFVYKAVRGPASYDIAIIGGTGDGTLAPSFCAAVKTYVLSQMPGHASLNVTAILNQELDIVIAMSLPLPKVAGGAGGGWRDATPWPRANVKVTAYSNDIATVNGSVAPAVGNHIGIWDPTEQTMREYTIATVSGSGPWTIAVQTGFGFNPTGAYVSAGASRLGEYADALAAQYVLLGPGEKTDWPELLPLALRQPGADVAYPSDVTSVQLNAGLSGTTFPEILNAAYALSVETGTSTARTSPGLPSAVADPPRRLKLKHLAIRRAT